ALDRVEGLGVYGHPPSAQAYAVSIGGSVMRVLGLDRTAFKRLFDRDATPRQVAPISRRDLFKLGGLAAGGMACRLLGRGGLQFRSGAGFASFELSDG